MSYRELHALGFSLIPITRGAKTPDATVLPRVYNATMKKSVSSWKQYQEVPADAAQLDKWFEKGDRNVGVIVGAISGFVGIDTDSAEAEAWVDANMPPTPMMTKTARGFHRFYRYPYQFEVPAFIRLPNNLSIEIRRDGQYLLAPGSVHPSGTIYTEVEPWTHLMMVPELPELVLQYRFAIAEHPVTAAGERPDFVAYGARGLEHLTGADTWTGFEVPDVIPQSERHHTLFKLMRSLKSKGSPLKAALDQVHEVNQHNCRPALDRHDVTQSMTRAYYLPDQPGYALPTIIGYDSRILRRLGAFRL